METQDGFILGVYNYCDRWCERCSLANRCRVFAEAQALPDGAEHEPEAGCRDTPSTSTVAPVLRSLGALAAAFEELPQDVNGPQAGVNPPRRAAWSDLPPMEADVHARVRALGHRLWGWIAPESRADDPAVRDAAAVLQHFAIFLSPKVYRALAGRRDEEWNAPDSDANGSAKAALLAIDRVADAWLRLAEHGAISVLEAAPVLTEIQRLTAEMEHLFPRARAFVRPGFDEPDKLAMLAWRERG